MNFKKTLCVILAAMAITCACASCGDSGNDGDRTEPTTVTYDVAATADKLKNEIAYEDSLVELDGTKIQNILGVAPDAYNTAKVYISSSGATPEEIAFFEAKNSSMATTIKASLDVRLTNQKNTFTDYKPDQIPKLDNAVLVIRDNYVIYCVSGDSAKAKEIID